MSTTACRYRFAVAPSGFKECLSAREAAEAIAEGLLRVAPDAEIDLVPLVDGGEGTAEALSASSGGSLIRTTATGPVGKPVPTHFALLGGEPATAVVEMAAVAGLSLVPHGSRDPGATTTYGVGELIRAALDTGVRRILVGCGDSGTSDGGAGALQALGARLLDERGRELPCGARSLARLDRIDPTGLDPRLADIEILVACNPYNVLCGPRGVARVFGPQKGAGPQQVEELSAALEHWANTLDRTFAPGAGGGSGSGSGAGADPDSGAGFDFGSAPDAATAPGTSAVSHPDGFSAGFSDRSSAAGGGPRPWPDLRHGPGTGASGGLGAGLAALGARLLPRFDVLLDHVGLDARLARADLVVTAEGSLDRQTPRGKIPAEVARRAKLSGRPVLALAGTIGDGAHLVRDTGIDAYGGILPGPVALPEALSRGREFLADAAESALRMVLLGSRLPAARPGPVALRGAAGPPARDRAAPALHASA